MADVPNVRPRLLLGQRVNERQVHHVEQTAMDLLLPFLLERTKRSRRLLCCPEHGGRARLFLGLRLGGGGFADNSRTNTRKHHLGPQEVADGAGDEASWNR